MGKQKEGSARSAVTRALLCGAAASVLLLVVLTAAALIAETEPELLRRSGLTARVCLVIAALLCGCIAAGRNKHHRLPLALAGEGVLFLALLVIGMGNGFSGGWRSMLIDVGLLLIGAFAGAVLTGKKQNKRRGKA